MAELRAFMFERVYLGPEATHEQAKIHGVVRALFEHYCVHPEEIPDSIEPRPRGQGLRLSGRHDRPILPPCV